MKVKALVSFAGAELSMYKGEVRECANEAVLSDLFNAKYIEEVKGRKTEKNESKRVKC